MLLKIRRVCGKAPGGFSEFLLVFGSKNPKTKSCRMLKEPAFINGKIGKNLSFNAAWYYMTGSPFSLSTGKTPSRELYLNLINYGIGTNGVAKNNIRMASYHRLDISIEHKVIKGKKRQSERVFNLGIYNVYNRPNPQYYFWETTNTKITIENGTIQTVYSKPALSSKSYFPIIPYISYSRNF